MAKLERLITVLHDLTGVPELVIERTVDKLVEANHLPSVNADLLPEDAAILIVALAAGRAPTEAVEAVAAYLAAPPVYHAIVDDDGERPVAIDPTAGENVIACLALLLSEISTRTKAGRHCGLGVEIRRSTCEPYAVVFDRADGRMRRFVFRGARERHGAWETWQVMSEDLFTAIAMLFDDHPAVAAESRLMAVH